MNKQYTKLFRDFYVKGGGYLRVYRKRKKHDQLLHTYSLMLHNSTAIISGPEFHRYGPLIVEYIVNNIKPARAIKLDRRYAW